MVRLIIAPPSQLHLCSQEGLLISSFGHISKDFFDLL